MVAGQTWPARNRNVKHSKVWGKLTIPHKTNEWDKAAVGALTLCI